MSAFSWEDVRRALALRPATAIADPGARRAAVALVLRETTSCLELLFIRRAEDPRDPWSGQMGFPGGRAEPGDTALVATAMRETAEEIGLDLARAAEPLGTLDEVRAMARMRPMNLTISPFVFRLREACELRLGSEVKGVQWISLDGLTSPEWHSMLDYVHEGQTLQFPCLRVDGSVIWGLTYRMLAGMLALLAEARGEQDPV